MHPFQRFTIVILHLNDIDCTGTHHPGRGKALQMNSERVFAATSAVSVEATNRKPLFVCSDMDCAFFTKHRRTDKTQSPFVIL